MLIKVAKYSFKCLILNTHIWKCALSTLIISPHPFYTFARFRFAAGCHLPAAVATQEASLHLLVLIYGRFFRWSKCNSLTLLVSVNVISPTLLIKDFIVLILHLVDRRWERGRHFGCGFGLQGLPQSEHFHLFNPSDLDLAFSLKLPQSWMVWILGGDLGLFY